ncbi:MAG TPA: aminotransferase class III-fold pyridoxal phosphate-dependent enzyme, partial [Planctomycetaceae bacterium]|nr:aminotransferase class III-fold pyridoxal phosphate-dependent enzyme [Planctomycetaceae bacterium]
MRPAAAIGPPTGERRTEPAGSKEVSTNRIAYCRREIVGKREMSQTASLAADIERKYCERFKKSQELYEQALRTFPGGVTHDLRYMSPFPVYIDRAEGSRKWSVEGHELVDWWSGHGAILLGHGAPAVVEAVRRQMGRGTHPGACHELELRWGSLVQELVPSAEMVRFVNSGTEATMMAFRLARTFTGRRKVLKFRGHFHGWNDFIIQDADQPYGLPVPGLGIDLEEELVVVPPNDLDRVAEVLAGDKQIACAILEPTGGHYGRVPIR